MGIFNIFGVVKYREKFDPNSKEAQAYEAESKTKKAYEADKAKHPENYAKREVAPQAQKNPYAGISQEVGGENDVNTTWRDNGIKARNAAIDARELQEYRAKQQQEQKQEQKSSHKPSKPQRCNTNALKAQHASASGGHVQQSAKTDLIQVHKNGTITFNF